MDVLYFSLEESKKKVILSEISKYIFKNFNTVISVRELQSRGRFNYLSPEKLKMVDTAEEYIEEYLDTVQIFETRQPTGIYKTVRNFAMKIGVYYDKNGKDFTKEECEMLHAGKGEYYKNLGGYRTFHPRHYVIILTDHIGLLSPEKGESLHAAMGRYSSKYCLRFRDTFGFIPVAIQQQASSKEQVEYNFKGQSIAEKLEPSLEGLGKVIIYIKIYFINCPIKITWIAGKPRKILVLQHN